MLRAGKAPGKSLILSLRAAWLRSNEIVRAKTAHRSSREDTKKPRPANRTGFVEFGLERSHVPARFEARMDHQFNLAANSLRFLALRPFCL